MHDGILAMSSCRGGSGLAARAAPLVAWYQSELPNAVNTVVAFRLRSSDRYLRPSWGD
ncbi:hypothetical protein Enr17x_15700 [Gimesia fumaroli]|uniref:Uncharacterized protein n=1 Tax=Gimesia fumaroli TaxID=2527976 RepID=A0A518I8X8_9PLAN|nr:hypothetical protein Enr17x_15700 [Gimesia fumaroli]